jgi:hypothetical protein
MADDTRLSFSSAYRRGVEERRRLEGGISLYS